MTRMNEFIFAFLIGVSITTTILAETGIMSSQVGYDLGDPMRVMIRCDRTDGLSDNSLLIILDPNDHEILQTPVVYWGPKWAAYWWIADLSELQRPGRYTLCLRTADQSIVGDAIEVGDHLLWDTTYHVIAYDYLKTRSEQARTGKGWKDCGSDLQEFSSHAVCVDGICDVLETAASKMTPDERTFLKDQLIRGCQYMAHLQDKARMLGLGHGAVIHEDRDRDVVTGNVAKAAMVFARVSRLIAGHDSPRSAEYLDRAERAFTSIEKHGPIIPPGPQTFFPFVHGAPAGSVPPTGQWMTRDLVTMARASVALFRAGRTEYKTKAIGYAKQIIKRQVPQNEAEGGLFGHFYTYDDFNSFGGVRFTEKANIHCGAWSKDGRVYNKGGHYPHYLMPLIDMLELWPDHPDAPQWRQCLQNFAFGYLIPACQQSPFLILPAGFYTDEGLVYFGSWYHAHNNIYAFTASLALELDKLFDDPQLRNIAVGNLQWIAGLNSGAREGQPPRYKSVSMIYGIGNRFRGSWSKIPGSVCNGFSASKQFSIAPISAETDVPAFFDDEAYIAHSLPYLAALARLEAYQNK